MLRLGKEMLIEEIKDLVTFVLKLGLNLFLVKVDEIEEFVSLLK